jgi:xylulokinase
VHVYEGVLGEHYYSMVAVQNAGLALSWAQSRLGITWDELSTMCQQAPPGAQGSLFNPFVAPERGALSPTRSRPGWITHQTGDHPTTALAARSAAEAQAFLVRRSWELLDVEARRVFVLGGGAREPWVRQLLANVLGKPVDHLPMRSASAAGAVILAGGPTLRDGRPPSATAAPRELPELEEAYQRWRSAMYA